MYLRLTLAFLITSLTTIDTFAQQIDPYSVPRTEHDHPDFQGVWILKFLTPLERPEEAQSLVMTPEQARKLVATSQFQLPELTDPDDYINSGNNLGLVKGEYRSSVIIQPEDGKIPFSEAGLTLANQIQTSHRQLFDHVEQRPLGERCIGGAGNPPIRPQYYGLPYQIVQSRDHVMIYPEDTSGVRIIKLNESNRPEALRSINGNSIGQWEGNTLSIETSHLSNDHPGRETSGHPVLIGENSRVIEAFTRVSETELLYQYTVEDPTFYTEPWSGEFSFLWLGGNTYEYSCHEGNYALPGILRGNQMEAARLAEEKNNSN